ncbi:hypothetical protein EDB86DRAFT_2932739 [Lactarius hatsudake]|nr:hypothetical protein EDB86DRAFT_2932739 [Lactarius hatsudake]
MPLALFHSQTFCFLLDIGTRSGPGSIYHLWKAFGIDSNVGGACGEIVAFKGKYGQTPLNPLVAAQSFEYKMFNILEKPLESCRASRRVQRVLVYSERRAWRVRCKTIPLARHCIARKLRIHVELVYQTFDFIFSWFALVRYPDFPSGDITHRFSGELFSPRSLCSR